MIVAAPTHENLSLTSKNCRQTANENPISRWLVAAPLISCGCCAIFYESAVTEYLGSTGHPHKTEDYRTSPRFDLAQHQLQLWWEHPAGLFCVLIKGVKETVNLLMVMIGECQHDFFDVQICTDTHTVKSAIL